jgi:hypothetical protein
MIKLFKNIIAILNAIAEQHHEFERWDVRQKYGRKDTYIKRAVDEFKKHGCGKEGCNVKIPHVH